VHDTESKRTRSLPLLAAVFVFLFLAIAGGYTWFLMRPVPGVLAVALMPDGTTLLTVNARLPVMPRQEMDLLPAPIRAAARAHRFSLNWRTVNSGETAETARFKLEFEDVRAIPPAACGDNILAARLPDRMALLTKDGSQLNEYVIKQCTVRSLAASADGRWAAFACSRAPMLKTQGRQPGLDPYARDNAGPQQDRPGAFRLFVSDCSLNNVREINAADFYPALGPGALAWDSTPALLFTGYAPDKHDMRLTYRLDPRSGAITPMPGNADWGQSFDVSPDGSAAVSVDGFNITFTNAADGVQTRIPAGPPIERVLPSWSHDGRRAALAAVPGIPGQSAANPATDPTGLKILVADPQKRTIVTSSKPVPNFICGTCRPFWSPDSKRLFINGAIFEERRSGFFVHRFAVLCFDIESGEVSFPKDPASLWK